MDAISRANLDNLFSQDRELQNRAFFELLAATKDERFVTAWHSLQAL